MKTIEIQFLNTFKISDLLQNVLFVCHLVFQNYTVAKILSVFRYKQSVWKKFTSFNIEKKFHFELIKRKYFVFKFGLFDCFDEKFFRVKNT